MPKIVHIDITGGHVVYQSIRRWRNRPAERKRLRQIKFHVGMLEEKAKLVLPVGTRFHIAIKGDVGVIAGVMEACYQSTAEMMFDKDWPQPVGDGDQPVNGWLIVLRGTVPPKSKVSMDE